MNFWRFKSSFGRNGQVTLAAFEVPFGQRVSKVRRLTCAAMLRALLKGPFKRGGIVVHSHCRSYGNSSHLENREFVCKSPSLCGIFILKLAPYYSLTSWARPRDKKKEFGFTRLLCVGLVRCHNEGRSTRYPPSLISRWDWGLSNAIWALIYSRGWMHEWWNECGVRW